MHLWQVPSGYKFNFTNDAVDGNQKSGINSPVEVGS